MSYIPIASQTLTAAVATVTFSAIPASYGDLVLVIVATGTSSGAEGRLRFNSDSTSNYEYVQILGSTTSASSAAGGLENSARICSFILDTSLPAQINTRIMDYKATDKHTVLMSRAGRTTMANEAMAARWPQTTAVTQIEVFPTAGNWAAGSTFALYGIEA
jgi:hypothetical protein